jgi:hypothetical protein
MRIQQTDRILKEAQAARRAAHHPEHSENMFVRAWRVVAGLFHRGD